MVIQANRPEPIISNIDVVPYKRQMGPQYAIDAIFKGCYVLIIDYYSSGLTILKELNHYLQKRHTDQSFLGQRHFRSEFYEVSNRILLRIYNNKLSVRKAPHIGWFKKLYPDVKEFLLPFPKIQGLNSSWQWYKKGVFILVLNRKIHPFFGTYFPTRFEHLELFDNWLKQYKGNKLSAIDVGIGCGVLSFQLLKYGFEKVYGTDINPNAIIGLKEDMHAKKYGSKLELMCGDLFVGCNQQTELIVFNPPWIPTSHDVKGIDRAVYYEKDLFPKFFTEAIKHLKADGKVVLLFSNLAQITGLTKNHPIKTELSDGGRFEKELFVKKKVSSASKNTRRNQHWRSSEAVELWVLRIR